MNLKSYLFILLISALISCSKDKTNTCTIIPSYDVEISSIINSYCIVCHQGEDRELWIRILKNHPLFYHKNKTFIEVNHSWN